MVSVWGCSRLHTVRCHTPFCRQISPTPLTSLVRFRTQNLSRERTKPRFVVARGIQAKPTRTQQTLLVSATKATRAVAGYPYFACCVLCTYIPQVTFKNLDLLLFFAGTAYQTIVPWCGTYHDFENQKSFRLATDKVHHTSG